MSYYDNNSNQYHVRVYRNPETKMKEDVMQEFVTFLKYEYESEPTDEQMKDILDMINSFLGYSVSKVMDGEYEMLEKWKRSATLKP